MGVDGRPQLLGGVPEVVRTHPLALPRVLESDDRAMLEWTSTCETAAGVRTSYDGVSVFETRDGRIVRFTAYFDPMDLSAKPRCRPAPTRRARCRRTAPPTRARATPAPTARCTAGARSWTSRGSRALNESGGGVSRRRPRPTCRLRAAQGCACDPSECSASAPPIETGDGSGSLAGKSARPSVERLLLGGALHDRHQLLDEGRDVGRLAARHQLLVDHDLLIHPLAAAFVMSV
jgi:hypothetical protein